MSVYYEVEKKQAMYDSHWYPVCSTAHTLNQITSGKTLQERDIHALAKVGIIAKDVTDNGLNAILNNGHQFGE